MAALLGKKPGRASAGAIPELEPERIYSA